VASAPPSGANGSSGSGRGAGSDELAAYVALVRERLAAHKRYPPLARKRGLEGSVLVRLAIAGDGALSDVHAVGSAPDLLARSAVDAARRASPLPPPPRGPVRIEVPMRFRISE
jgi:protein TonB